MAAIRHQSSWGSSIAAGVTNYIGWGMGTSGSASTTEANVQNTIQVAGTISKFWVYVSANSLSGTITYRIRKNTANGNQVITVSAGVTGAAEDASNTDSVSAGDVINQSNVTAAGSGSATAIIFASTFAATTNSATVFTNTRGGGRSWTADSTDNFPALTGGLATGGIEVEERIKFLAAGTFQKLGVRITVNSRATTTTFRFRVNGANGNQVVSITATTTGLLQDTSNTDANAVNDFVGYMLSTSTGGGTLTGTLLSCIWVSTASKGYYVTGGRDNLAAGTTAYTAASGAHVGGGPAEAAISHKLSDVTVTLSNYAVYITANAVLASSTFRPRINSANGNQVVTVGTLATGYFEDTSNTDVITTATDVLGIQRIAGAGGTTIDHMTDAMLATYATAAIAMIGARMIQLGSGEMNVFGGRALVGAY